MKKQLLAFLLLALTAFFWFWATAAVATGLHFLFTGDFFSGMIFLIGLVFSGLYALILKRNRKLREITSKFLDRVPPIPG